MERLHVLAVGGMHQLAHFLPVAFEVFRRGSAEVTIFTRTPADTRAVEHLATSLHMPCPPVVEMTVPFGLERCAPAFLHKWLRLLVWARRVRAADVLFCAERTSTVLKRWPGQCPPLLHMPHGAGDRAVGFEPRFRLFDKVLVAGVKDRDRLIAEEVVTPDKCEVVGPVKLAAMLRLDRIGQPLFANDRPVLLYNPHFSGKLGSLASFGRKLVDAVLRDGRYNLIVAPHVRLAQQWSAREKQAWQDLAVPDRVRVDLGSDSSVDMTYTLAADLYIGDVSSQIYEFVTRPRPCLFVNAHQADWQDNPDYAMWALGEVITPDHDPVAAIDRAFASAARYRPLQEARVQGALDGVCWRDGGRTISLGVDPVVRAAYEVVAMLARQGAEKAALAGGRAPVPVLEAAE